MLLTRACRFVDRHFGVTRSFNGKRLRLPTPTRVHFSYFSDCHYEREEWKSTKCCRPGDTAVDVGANIGVISAFLADAVSATGCVYALEPNPSVFSLLTETISMNSYGNVIPLQVAAGSALAVSDFYIEEWGAFQPCSSLAPKTGTARAQKVIQAPLDFLLAGVSRIDYIKLDVEGAELNVLRGAVDLIEKHRPLIQVEVHGMYMPSFGDSVADLFAFLCAREYSALNLVDDTIVDVTQFEKDTKLHVATPYNGSDGATQGYGQLLFFNSDRSYISKLFPCAH